MTSVDSIKRKWRRPRLFRNGKTQMAVTGIVILYFVLTISSLEVNWVRIALGVQRSQRILLDFLQPDFATRWGQIVEGITESLTMTLVATVMGVMLAIPVAFGAARNVSSRSMYYFFRSLITLLRSLQEVIIAIFFVVMFGFGPLAGTLTLAVASVGFLGKLLAEEIEAIDEQQIEAIRATGASWLQMMVYGVWPQIRPRFLGLSVYRLDINFRESAIIGVVGAGGIGATLTTAFDRYEFRLASAILMLIVAIVLCAEYFSGRIRRAIQ